MTKTSNIIRSCALAHRVDAPAFPRSPNESDARYCTAAELLRLTGSREVAVHRAWCVAVGVSYHVKSGAFRGDVNLCEVAFLLDRDHDGFRDPAVGSMGRLRG